ncbi:MAG: ABC transporter substrate-binding protein [Pseudolysinimonas sp.]
MRSRITAAIAAVAAVTLVLVGCAGLTADAGSDPNNPNQVEVFTWWASGNEKTSFKELVGVFAEQYPDIQFIDASVRGSGGAQARAAIAARLESNNPPDSFQAAAGAGLTDYISAGQIQDLTSWYADNGLSEGVYRAALLELLGVDGKIYSVPSEIHRVNVVWANTHLLDEAGVDSAVAPANIDAWIADLERVRESGVEYPLALGNDWTQVQLFENVLVSDLGAVLYQNLWKSTKNWEGDRLRTAVDHYSQLLAYVDPSSLNQEWNEATQTVVDGKAAYVIMADFALTSFQQAGYAYGKQYVAFPTPGTVGVFDFLADSFTLPVGAVHEKAAMEWLLTVSSAEGQKALSLKKGSIPARTDTNADDYPPYQQTAIASLQLDTVVPSIAHGVAANPSWTKAITTAVVKFAGDGHPEALVNALIAAAHSQLD